MNILVRNEEDNNDINNDKSIMKSKNIICPENPQFPYYLIIYLFTPRN